MCGRYFVQDDDEAADIAHIIEEIDERYTGVPGYKAVKRGEVFPTDTAAVITDSGTEAAVWGYPSYKGKGVIINARSETAAEKKTFSEALLFRRCAVATSGFFEWSHDENKIKYLFTVPDEKTLYLAGLYGFFDGVRRFVILTAAANASIRPIHDRMPVVLSAASLTPWLTDRHFALGVISAPLPMLDRLAV